RTTGDQLGAGDRIPTCKERHIVAKPHEFFGQIGSDPFGATIQTRRNALDERSHLGDLHVTFNLQTNTSACSAAKFSCSSMRPASTTSFSKKALRLPWGSGWRAGNHCAAASRLEMLRLPTTTAAIYWKWAFIPTACCRF